MSDFENLWIWNRKGIKSGLSRYYPVALNKKPAKYLICKRIPVEVSLRGSTEQQLWSELERLTPRFLQLWSAIKSDQIRLSDLPKAGPNLIRPVC